MSGRLVAIHPGALGDVVLLGHLLGALEGPKALAGGLEKAQLLAGLGRVDQPLDFAALAMGDLFDEDPDGGWDADPKSAGRLGRQLGRCDRLISFFCEEGSLPARRLVEATGAREAHFLPVRPPPDWPGHLLDLWADRLGVRRLPRRPPAWPVPPAWGRQADSLLRSAGLSAELPLAVLHPGSGSPAKNWPMTRYVQLADALADQAGMRVAMVIGPVELERGDRPEQAHRQENADRPEQSDRGAGRGRMNVIEQPPLSALAGLLGRARLCVGNDSGVTHLAGAVGTPTVALFGPSSPVHFAPRGPAVRVLAGGSMQSIAVARVLEAGLAGPGGSD